MRSAAGTIALAIVLCGVVLAHGDLHGQIQAVSTQIRASPDRADLYFKRAELQRLHGEWQASAADYARVAELDPAFDAVHLGRGKLLFATGRFDAAVAELDRYLIPHPGHVDALATRARINLRRDRPLRAAEDFASAIALSPSPEPELYLEQAQAFAAAGSKHDDDAIRVLDEGMAKLGSLPSLALYAIELEVARKRYDPALARVDALAAGAPRQEPWLERRGDILALAGREAEARDAWRGALAAIAKLPPHVRTNRATAEREARLRARLGTPSR